MRRTSRGGYVFMWGLVEGSATEEKAPPRPYGVEALCRDNSGNWRVLVKQKFNSGEATATLHG